MPQIIEPVAVGGRDQAVAGLTNCIWSAREMRSATGQGLIELFQEVRAEVATMRTPEMGDIGDVGAKASQDQLDACVLDVSQVAAELNKFQQCCSKNLFRSAVVPMMVPKTST